MTATETRMPFDTDYFQVLYVGHFAGTPHYAVFAMRLDGKLVQINDTTRNTADGANRLARNMAQYDGVNWYGYNG